MGKALLSSLILIVTVVVSIILYGVVLDNYPVFGTFENLLFLGFVTFFLGVGVFLSAWLLERMIREMKEKKNKV